MSATKIINYLTGKPRIMLLIDAIGALTTSLMLGIVLAKNVALFGMPTDVLQPLSAVASCFAVYSFCVYLFAKKYKLYIRIIALANLSYCIASAALTIINRHTLTTIGMIYFIGEILTIISLIYIEWNVANGVD